MYNKLTDKQFSFLLKNKQVLTFVNNCQAMDSVVERITLISYYDTKISCFHEIRFDSAQL